LTNAVTWCLSFAIACSPEVRMMKVVALPP